MRNSVFDNPDLLKVWIWCLLKATHAEYGQTVGLQKVDLLPGQFVFGRKAASAELRMSENKTYRLMMWLKSEAKIDIKANNKYSIVTVVNWGHYQGKGGNNEQLNRQQIDNKQTTNRQQIDTNKNTKNTKNNKNIRHAQTFDIFWEAYPKKLDKRRALTAWLKLEPDDGILQEILPAIEQQSKSHEWIRESGRFIPYPATWLNGRRWEDEVTQEAPAEPSKRKFSEYEF